jgi:nucleotide-binding universal stress UspA family protein
MTYKTLMVHLELNRDNAGLLQIAGTLAEQFKARVIGIAACQPTQTMYPKSYGPDKIMAEDRAKMTNELAAAEMQFRTTLAGHATNLDWRSAITYLPLAEYISEQSRAADLIITGKDIGGTIFDNTRRVNIGSLAMRSGRPILLVPPGISSLSLEHVFVGWKDTRETRRALADALPLLHLAKSLTILGVTPHEGQLPRIQSEADDVAGWLEQHQIAATPTAVTAQGPDVTALHSLLRAGMCDLLVAGAYGHNRYSEWVFGGVTQDFLLSPDLCVLLSH